MPIIRRQDIPNNTSETVRSILLAAHMDGAHSVKSQIPAIETLAEVYANSIPDSESSFSDFKKALQDKAKNNVETANTILQSRNLPTISAPTGSAFNNCNGKWSEYAYAVYAWNFFAELNSKAREDSDTDDYDSYLYVKLPNSDAGNNDWTHLLVNNITIALEAYPQRQSSKITDQADSNYGRRFELISSNPDAVILKFPHQIAEEKIRDLHALDLYSPIDNMSHDTISNLDALFRCFIESVIPSKNLQCFLSIKTSTRPDRRYQWIHEGDHVKSILQWIQVFSSIAPTPLDSDLNYTDLNGKFFAISLSKLSGSDENTMNTGTVGSIVSPMLNPVWAVDKLFECITFSQVGPHLQEMLSF